MHDHDDTNELPYLNDDDIKLLYSICERAAGSDEPPFKALFAAYDEVFAEEQLDPLRDGSVFRYVMCVGESTRVANRERRPVNLVKQLKSILETLGITLENVGEDETVEQSLSQRPGRRVSFDDARYEKTWLSEHTESITGLPSPWTSRNLLGRSPRRKVADELARRARSTSPPRNAAKALSTVAATPDDQRTNDDREHSYDNIHPKLSLADLDENAEAFLATSEVRLARRALNYWYDVAMRHKQTRNAAYASAVSHDRQALLEQSLELWREALHSKRKQHLEQQRTEQEWLRKEKRAIRFRDFMLVRKAFTHWALSAEDEKLRVAVAKKHMLRYSYFRRWKAITEENQRKTKIILCRKFLAIWRNKTARRLVQVEQAEAHYEELLMRRYKAKWFWSFCSSRVASWNQTQTKRRALADIRKRFLSRRDDAGLATQHYCTHLAHQTFDTLRKTLQARQDSRNEAQRRSDRSSAARCLQLLHVQSRLAPIASTAQRTLDRTLVSKALHIWQLNAYQSRKAAIADRQRLLQNAWSTWNDALRSNALKQRINERLVAEYMYRWVLQERLQLFQRSSNGRLLSRAVQHWRAKVEEDRDRLVEAEIVFAERQRRRKLIYGMQRLNLATRAHEDAERAATECEIRRELPKVLAVWKNQTTHVRRLAKMASDARFYCLSYNTLKVWKERTTESVANRRRDAYLHIREQVKTRLAKNCLTKMQNAASKVHSMLVQAEQIELSRLGAVATAAFDQWRDKTASYFGLQAQASESNRRKLLAAAVAALQSKQAEHERIEQEAIAFKHETDLALLAGALRRMQWATFTATRKAESADALLARNRDQHVKQMLRHWSSQAVTKRSVKAHGANANVSDKEPESPSLRPASRAASRSRDRSTAFPASPQTNDMLQLTPGYLRTPSRNRRAGRFRPLPTPATFTPLAFNDSYLVTTPAPLLGNDENDPPAALRGTEGLTPQITPFSRKLRAGGVLAGGTRLPPSALRGRDLGRSILGASSKSVRFAGASRFQGSSLGEEQHIKYS